MILFFFVLDEKRMQNLKWLMPRYIEWNDHFMHVYSILFIRELLRMRSWKMCRNKSENMVQKLFMEISFRYTIICFLSYSMHAC